MVGIDINFVFLPVLVFFPNFFGQVMECPILKLHDIIRVIHVLACPVVFIWFYDRDIQGGVLKFIKNDHFFILLPVCVLYPKFLGR